VIKKGQQGLVGPVQILDDDDQRFAGSDSLKEPPPGGKCLTALDRPGGLRG
jgi:hypothetical protein